MRNIVCIFKLISHFQKSFHDKMHHFKILQQDIYIYKCLIYSIPYDHCSVQTDTIIGRSSGFVVRFNF